jgi:hypothetical protein
MPIMAAVEEEPAPGAASSEALSALVQGLADLLPSSDDALEGQLGPEQLQVGAGAAGPSRRPGAIFRAFAQLRHGSSTPARALQAISYL